MLTKPTSIRWLKLSATVTALFLFVLANVLVTYTQPLNGVNFSNGYKPVDQDYFPEKLEIAKSSKPPDVLLLGSSLAMIATYCADSLITPVEWPVSKNAWRSHSKAEYLERALFKTTGKNFSVLNFGGPGGHVGDHSQVLEKMIEIGRAPKIVVMCVGFRDYGKRPHKDIWRARSMAHPSVGTDWSNQSVEAAANTVYGSLCRLYAARRDYQELISVTLAELDYCSWNVLTTLDKLQHEKLDLRKPANEERVEQCLDGYRKLYAKLDRNSVESELAALSNCLKKARQHSIKAVVVQMPLTERNRMLLPETFRRELSNRVEATCELNNATYLEYSANPSFTQDDFMDSVHLTRGAHKVFDLIASDLGQLQF